MLVEGYADVKVPVGGTTCNCMVNYRSRVQSLPAHFYADDEIKSLKLGKTMLGLLG